MLAMLNVAFSFLLRNIIDFASEGNFDGLIIAILIALGLMFFEFVFSYFSRFFGLSYVSNKLQYMKNNRLFSCFQEKTII